MVAIAEREQVGADALEAGNRVLTALYALRHALREKISPLLSPSWRRTSSSARNLERLYVPIMSQRLTGVSSSAGAWPR